MNKKYIDPKTTKIEISKLRSEGFTDKEIFTQLSEVYYDKDELAKLIKFYTSDESIEKVSFEINVLKGMFIIILLMNLLTKLDSILNSNFFSYYYYNLSNLIFETSPFLMILILISLFQKEITPWTYFLIILYSIFSVSSSFVGLLYEYLIHDIEILDDEVSIFNFGLNIILAIIFFTFSTNIKSTLFPNLKFKDMFGVKKDMNGEYIFE